MNLLKNRPLALFCLIFIFIASFVYALPKEHKLLVGGVVLCAVAICALLCVFLRCRRVGCIFALLCFFSAFLAVISQWAFIDLKRESALGFLGEREVCFVVVSEEYSSEYSSEYRVRLKRIDGESVSLKSVAVMGFASEYEAGDEIYARAVICPAGEEILGYARESDGDIYIHTAVYDANEAVVVSTENKSLEIILGQQRRRVSEYMDSVLGEDTSALSRAFLLGDKSDLPSSLLRDFRRAGVSHILSVSGLHISVLVGALDFLLRRLKISKGIRCVFLSAAALIFLAMTGFSLSACRSVFMLMSVYFCYLFVQEKDAVTSLFVSVALIMLIFPHSVRDVGLWLSFLATLGIVAVYIPVGAYLRKPPRKGAAGRVLKILRTLILALLLTFICNAFICAVIWAVFGEMSLIALLSNLVISPMSEVFIIFIPIALLIGRIPFVGGLFIGILSALGECITYLCGYFSDLEGVVISLRYPFAGAIILLMSIAMSVMLVINLKKKWTVLLPPIAACAAFALCLCGYNLIHMGELGVFCYSYGKNEMIVLTEGYSAAVCDLSSGAYSFTREASYIASDGMATEISEYILTHYHSRQSATLDKMFRNTLMRKIYLPYPNSTEEYDIASDIIESAKEQGVEVELYEYGSQIEILDGSWASVLSAESVGENDHSAISAVFGNRNEILCYINAGTQRADAFDELVCRSDYVIFGRHGVSLPDKLSFGADTAGVKRFYYTAPELYLRSNVAHAGSEVYIAPQEEATRFELILD